LTDRAPLDYIALLRAGGSRPVFTGYGSDGTSNIYRARSGRAEPIAVVGQSMPGGGVLRELHQFASAGHRVLFIASVANGASVGEALFAWTARDGLARLASADVVAGTDTTPGPDLLPTATGPALLIGYPGGIRAAIFAARHGDLDTLISEGDQTRDGVTLSAIRRPVTSLPRRLVFGGTITQGTSMSDGVLVFTGRHVKPLALAGDAIAHVSDGVIATVDLVPCLDDVVVRATLTSGDTVLAAPTVR